MSTRRPVAPDGAGGLSQIVSPDTIDPTILPAMGIFGDGSDGNVTIPSGTTTLTSDKFYDTLTVQSGGVLKTAQFRVMCKTLCQVQSGGTIQSNGNNAVGAAAGVAIASGSLIGCLAGAAGATGNPAASGGSTSNSWGGKGGAGGAGSIGAAGTAGTVFGLLASVGPPRMLPGAALGLSIGAGASLGIGAGTGGGGGGGDTTNSGGGGGSSGGIVLINAPAINNQGTIQALGGNGANGVAGNAGGGGGGGGGVVVLNTRSALVGNAPLVTGGTGGTKAGTGANGSNGSTGTIFANVWT